jgi:hypothetical protein
VARSLVVDDATLLAVLTKRADPDLVSLAASGGVLTTISWYYRVHRALHDPASSGALSAMVAGLGPVARNTLFNLLDDLPTEIVIPGPRILVPVMGALRLRRRPNFLTAEALAAALVSDSRLRVTTESALLRDGCEDVGVDLQVLTPFA